MRCVIVGRMPTCVPPPRESLPRRPRISTSKMPRRPTTLIPTKPERPVTWLERVVEINDQEWQPVGTPAFIACSSLVAVVCYFANTGEHWVYVLDSANLVFHEAGHPFFGLLLGERITVYGGPLGPLVF